ncbi:hypothetical protein HAX54_016199 [Datura stramonium]|uniref:Uncharacterized protein n=1 Tax=Datura stramonium TaxID=4076 RepID=A0ABS8UIF6_DATST|nr:hypothetical protein [Datura stramonium]
MRERHNQRGWLAQVLTNGQLSWLANTKEKMVKSTLTFVAREDHIPILAGIDVETYAKEKTSGRTARATETSIEPAGEATRAELERQPPEFSIVKFEELEDDAPFIDLFGEHPKAIGKCSRDDVRDEGKSHKKKKHMSSKQEKAELQVARK